MNNNFVYALDFDGVICDSALETGMSGWKAARRIWEDMPEAVPCEVISRFRQIRPIIETGYESILAVRLLHCGASVETLYSNYVAEFRRLMLDVGADSEELKKLFGETRDAWVEADKQGWVKENPLYPGVVEKLVRLSQKGLWYVITTKQQRFVQLILEGNGISLDKDRIFGLDRKMSKAEVLKLLALSHPEHIIHFIEDRLQTLENIKRVPEVSGVKLYLAVWGYNTDEEKRLAATEGFSRISLDEFLA
jgi:phosphoglycolate phosphatase-like HAD superfamily hydrolase